jgi:hypothetical protein
VDGLLSRAEAAFQRADAALRAGNLATFQEQVEIARGLIDEAARLIERARGE